MIGPIWIDESIPSRGGSELYEIFDTTPQIWRQYTDWPLMVAAMIFLVAYPIQVIANLSDNQAGSIALIIWITRAAFVIDYEANLVMAPQPGR